MKKIHDFLNPFSPPELQYKKGKLAYSDKVSSLDLEI